MVMMTHDKQKLLKYHKKKDQLYLQENLNSKNCY